MSKLKQVGRLAMRHEGQNWNAYYALPDTMDGAIFLGSLSMRFASIPQHKTAFMSFMRSIVSEMIRDAVGVHPEWKEPYRAPEHERSGNS